jgi:hypothetical protein
MRQCWTFSIIIYNTEEKKNSTVFVLYSIFLHKKKMKTLKIITNNNSINETNIHFVILKVSRFGKFKKVMLCCKNGIEFFLKEISEKKPILRIYK